MFTLHSKASEHSAFCFSPKKAAGANAASESISRGFRSLRFACKNGRFLQKSFAKKGYHTADIFPIQRIIGFSSDAFVANKPRAGYCYHMLRHGACRNAEKVRKLAPVCGMVRKRAENVKTGLITHNFKRSRQFAALVCGIFGGMFKLSLKHTDIADNVRFRRHRR